MCILSRGSPDWYERAVDVSFVGHPPPFRIRLVKAGSRIGYRWESENYLRQTSGSNPCEVNWLDPEPDRESSDYDEYIEDLQVINSQVGLYRGFHQPPTEEEYLRLLGLV